MYVTNFTQIDLDLLMVTCLIFLRIACCFVRISNSIFSFSPRCIGCVRLLCNNKSTVVGKEWALLTVRGQQSFCSEWKIVRSVQVCDGGRMARKATWPSDPACSSGRPCQAEQHRQIRDDGAFPPADASGNVGRQPGQLQDGQSGHGRESKRRSPVQSNRRI